MAGSSWSFYTDDYILVRQFFMLKLFNAVMPPVVTEWLNWYASESCNRKKQLSSVEQALKFCKGSCEYISTYLDVLTEIALNNILMLHSVINLNIYIFQSHLVTSVILYSRKKADISDMPKSQRPHDKCIEIFCDGIFIFPWVQRLWNYLIVFPGTRSSGWGHVGKIWDPIWAVG